ncbi:hypothetical protein BH11PLA1_BH11PLA1_12950 [soil metagenome]
MWGGRGRPPTPPGGEKRGHGEEQKQFLRPFGTLEEEETLLSWLMLSGGARGLATPGYFGASLRDAGKGTREEGKREWEDAFASERRSTGEGSGIRVGLQVEFSPGRRDACPTATSLFVFAWKVVGEGWRMRDVGRAGTPPHTPAGEEGRGEEQKRIPAALWDARRRRRCVGVEFSPGRRDACPTAMVPKRGRGSRLSFRPAGGTPAPLQWCQRGGGDAG